MKQNLDFFEEYRKIVGRNFPEEQYCGPEEEARKIIPCNILKPVEIEYSNQIDVNI